MWKQRTWKRTTVMLAGPITHFVLAFLVLYLLAVDARPAEPDREARRLAGVELRDRRADATRSWPNPTCAPGAAGPAQAAGIRPGDEITGVGGLATPTLDRRWSRRPERERPHRVRRPPRRRDPAPDRRRAAADRPGAADGGRRRRRVRRPTSFDLRPARGVRRHRWLLGGHVRRRPRSSSPSSRNASRPSSARSSAPSATRTPRSAWSARAGSAARPSRRGCGSCSSCCWPG